MVQFFTSDDKETYAPERFQTSSNGTGNGNGTMNLPPRHAETGIDVLIVGAGVGGLMTAMECWRKGHNVVRIVERNECPIYTGDSLNIQPSAMSIFRHWPDMCREIETEQYDAMMSYKKHSGEHIYGPSPPSFNDPENKVGRLGPHVAFIQNRIKFYKMFLRQIAKLGFRIDYGQRVVNYFEDTVTGKGGVVLETGEVYLADVVVAADGLKSSSYGIVTGESVQPRPSGMAIYRTAYPVEYALQNETVRQRWSRKDDDGPLWEFWLGPGMHVAVFLSHDTASWALTHRDSGSAEESWEPDAHPDEVLKIMEQIPGWDPAIPALMRTAPRGAIVHWPLLWRDLRREWVSPGGRVIQVGDSAHSFLPSSGNGATQALEDAVTLATCLQLAGQRNAPLAAKIFNLLRYERVSCAQKMAFVNAQIKHQTDWKAIEQNPKLIRTRFPKWVYQHDPEGYAYEKYGPAFAHLVAGAPFQNTNFPPGHHFRPWTIDEVMEDIKNGKNVEDLLDGDWS
ncbi:hypothetical protein EYZ11_002927 [Aspergillus tanneri]|uniref:FAD-binding domain-containing protein n=1 Tax=Aspergillus tanneri TaxID=1220188 RepID=A0A4S3JPL9_9EURO|nr:uncharacterized protein ATNIH1004_009521 [Aspergillus tanneri]KAA8642769.1 hypothetical protein ATNIH1004_009521 [Aspergillus tanneri]THC97572.1 hypothetical protein EYZ11_002927 [Aspergillus tanneri]